MPLALIFSIRFSVSSCPVTDENAERAVNCPSMLEGKNWRRIFGAALHATSFLPGGNSAWMQASAAALESAVDDRLDVALE